MKPLPAIVISGFLGAGKTTLLNRLLAHGSSTAKVGVIVNDFGKLNVDARLVRNREHPLLELSNGCVCCSLQLGLFEAVRTLAARGDLELLVIEASGISLSSALLHALKSAELADAVQLSKVIAVVDARRYTRVLHSLPVIRDQIVHADFILLNHCDEVDAATTEAAKQRLRKENSDAPIVTAEYGGVDVGQLLGRATWTRRLEHPQRHDERWHAYEVVMPDDLDLNELRTLVDRLPETVERVKGFVGPANELHVLQKVGSFPVTLQRWDGGSANDRRNRLVIVAREPIEAELAQLFRGSLSSLQE
jgi:G3E family GTPase